MSYNYRKKQFLKQRISYFCAINQWKKFFMSLWRNQSPSTVTWTSQDLGILLKTVLLSLAFYEMATCCFIYSALFMLSYYYCLIHTILPSLLRHSNLLCYSCLIHTILLLLSYSYYFTVTFTARLLAALFIHTIVLLLPYSYCHISCVLLFFAFWLEAIYVNRKKYLEMLKVFYFVALLFWVSRLVDGLLSFSVSFFVLKIRQFRYLNFCGKGQKFKHVDLV